MGYIVKPYKKILRRSIVNRAFYKIKELFPSLVDIDVRQIANSYFGMMGNGNCYNLRKHYANLLKECGYQVDRKLTKIIL